MQKIKKVVIIGPESTGKSTLCQQLAQHYGTSWCAEYAREYLLQNGTDYTYDDLLTIARGQLLLQQQAAEAVVHRQLTIAGSQLPEANSPFTIHNSQFTTHNSQFTTHNSPLLFIDTDMYVMKVWCEYVFGKCHQFILDEIVQQQYDLYLLCKPDIAWVKEELREYPDEKIRMELYHIYNDILINQKVKWIVVSGDYEQRLKISVNAVERTLNENREV